MSTAAQVRAAWLTNVFQQSSVQALTETVYDYELNERTIKERAKSFFGQRVNYFSYIVKRTPRQEQINSGTLAEYEYIVEVNYYLERDPDSSNYNTAIDAFETVNSEVLSTLGYTWASTVDFSLLPREAPAILDANLGDIRVWRVTQTYRGYKTF